MRKTVRSLSSRGVEFLRGSVSVREDQSGDTSGVPVVTSVAAPGS